MINVNKITKSFGEKLVLSDTSFEIPDGSIVGLVGTNGAGKSTILRIISGIYEADEGNVEYDGENVFDNEKVKQEIVLIPDELCFLRGASLKRMADFYENYYESFDRNRFDELVTLFKLDKKANLSGFSKGMRRQAALILGLSVMNKYLFLDETFDGLDPVIRRFVKSLIIRDVEERKRTFVLSSHSLRELEDLCDKIVFIYDKKVVFSGDTNDLKTEFFKVQVAFKDDFDKELFGDIKLIDFEKKGSVANLVVEGEKEKTIELIKAKNPVIMEVVPMNLEEIFMYQMGLAGYKFDPEMTGGENVE